MDGEFFWGVATSAYQVEGGYNGPGQPRTNWAAAEERGDVAVTGAAADFWHRYEDDFARCRALGLNAFRLGIEWSRVQPTLVPGGTEPPPFDFGALDQYVAMFTACRRHGLEPVVTLHHFVHPDWLGADAWLDSRTPARFVEYVRTAVAYVNARLEDPLRWFITINEPNMLVINSYFGRQFPAGDAHGYAPMAQATAHLLQAHVLAYNAIHDLASEHGWPAPQVAFNNYASDLYWLDKFLLDLACLRERGIRRAQVAEEIHARSRTFERALAAAQLTEHRDLPALIGRLFKRCISWIARRRFAAADFAPFLEALYASPRKRVLDYIGIDYYDPFAAHAFRLPVWWDHEFKSKSRRAWILDTITSKWWDWRALPRGLGFFCRHYAADFGRPVLIAENGMAQRRRPDGAAGPHHPRRDRLTRSDFLRLHVHEVQAVAREGVPVIGYLHWSLVDNYEWGTYTPRFGLFSIDYPTSLERNAVDPLGDQPSETYAALIREAREARVGERRTESSSTR